MMCACARLCVCVGVCLGVFVTDQAIVLHLFYKNTFYKNIQAEIIKNKNIRKNIFSVIEGFFETAFPSLTRSAEESFVCQIMAP